MDWRANLLTTNAAIQAVLEQVQRIAVLGIRSERLAHRPAFYVPAFLASLGLEIVPVPVYERDRTHILGQPVYRMLAAVPGPIDLVNVFRRSEALPRHLDDLLAKQPQAVWFQSGIRHDPVAEILAQAGIKVVQDRCLMVAYHSMGRSQQGRRGDRC